MLVNGKANKHSGMYFDLKVNHDNLPSKNSQKLNFLKFEEVILDLPLRISLNFDYVILCDFQQDFFEE